MTIVHDFIPLTKFLFVLIYFLLARANSCLHFDSVGEGLSSYSDSTTSIVFGPEWPYDSENDAYDLEAIDAFFRLFLQFLRENA